MNGRAINQLIAFQCVTVCSDCEILSQAKYSFLSQQTAMSVRERAGFLSQKRISELVWDSENKEVGGSSHSISYFRNRILCIFRQPLKYLCFSHSSVDALSKNHVELEIIAQVCRLKQY